MIKVVVFDVGNVVWRHGEMFYEFQNEWSKILGITYDEFRNSYEKVYVGFEYGRSVVWDWFKSIKPEVESRVFENVFKNIMSNKIKFESYYNDEVVALIKELKGRYKIGLLSNAENYVYPYVHKRMEGWFDFSIISWQAGYRKPEEEIYKLIFKQGDFRPEEIVFIDDREENVGAAKKLGINGIIFENYDKLVCELNKLGVRV
jgi:putative hydrolase of the HAD superfamily